MPVTLTLPTTSTDSYVDAVRVYKRVDHLSFAQLTEETLGTATYVDVAGLVGDEYHCTFYSTTLGIESLPSQIYRVQTPWGESMSVILELQTSSSNPSVDQIAVYRRRFAEANAVRLAALPIGTQYYTDPTGLPGDEYHTTFLDSLTLAESQPGPSVIADAGAGLVVVTGFARDIRDTHITLGPGSYDPFGAGPRIHVTLVWPKAHITPSANGKAIIRTHYNVQVLTDGRWSVPLVANDLMTAPNAYYEFEFSDGSRYFKRIETENGAAQNFSLLADVKPLELR